MSKRDDIIVKNAINWISKIRPEYQMEELTGAMQRVVLNHAKYMQGICFAAALGFVGTLMMGIALEHMVSNVEEKEMKMQKDIDIIKAKLDIDDEN